MYRDNTKRKYDYEYFEYLRDCTNRSKREQAYKSNRFNSVNQQKQQYYNNTQKPEVKKEEQAYTHKTQTSHYSEQQLNNVSKKGKMPEITSLLESKFWLVLVILCALPIINSTVHNLISIVHNLSLNAQLSKEEKSLKLENKDLENKLKSFNSKDGIKKAIKEEINLIENNEIVIKIID